MGAFDFDVFAESDEAVRLFESFVPHGDEAFMVLKAHLVAERGLTKFIAARVSSEFLKDAIDRNSPCSTGLGLILLAEGLSLRDEVPQTHANIVWPALKILNGIRNQLAHELEPNTENVHKKMRRFIDAAALNSIGNPERNFNQSFRDCLTYVIALLAIDICPHKINDIAKQD